MNYWIAVRTVPRAARTMIVMDTCAIPRLARATPRVLVVFGNVATVVSSAVTMPTAMGLRVSMVRAPRPVHGR